MTLSTRFLLKFFILLYYALIPLSLISVEDSNISPREDRKKTVCLNMIVKNESKVIKRCLRSVLPFIDTWVIVDTGSSDNTKEIIIDFMKEHKIPGELHERPWVNFGHNREEALTLAKNKADYLMFMDADDILYYPPQFTLPDLIHDVYLIKGRDKGMQFHLWVFVKASLNWHWHDPIHEHITIDDLPDDTIEGGILHGIEYVYIHDGARSKDPSTLAKDLKILTDILEKDPENKRMTYHLAHTYFNINNLHKALEYYQKRIDLGGNPQEVFAAMMYKAKIQEKLNVKPDVLRATYQKALEFRPTRPEPIYYLARDSRIRGDFQTAYDIAKKGIDLPLSTDVFDLEYSTYEGIIFECAYCALELNKLKECKDLCRILTEKNNLSRMQQENLKAIKKFLEDKISSKEVLKVINKYYGEDN